MEVALRQGQVQTDKNTSTIQSLKNIVFQLFSISDICCRKKHPSASNSMIMEKEKKTLLIYEVFLFASTVLIECIRLLLGQKHNDSLRHAPFNQRLRSIFQILVLTVPSMYAILYFTAWQTVVTRLDAILGVLMILLQTAQFVSAFIHILL
ncbi:unnamed protein product [Lepeophtheirus salmonis]|uniref:(salmon louse) hypothetical protein n=1 Tax=Lepeophtheirus salmonis TaxID=72036 RepID=A0A7R8D0Q9_LEPSM|nr:unnamed protein product [Lepeophtheirus salmonis]CAF2986611.1 unnamed protein product [Lepeophtheirus salmonis]